MNSYDQQPLTLMCGSQHTLISSGSAWGPQLLVVINTDAAWVIVTCWCQHHSSRDHDGWVIQWNTLILGPVPCREVIPFSEVNMYGWLRPASFHERLSFSAWERIPLHWYEDIVHVKEAYKVINTSPPCCPGNKKICTEWIFKLQWV